MYRRARRQMVQKPPGLRSSMQQVDAELLKGLKGSGIQGVLREMEVTDRAREVKWKAKLEELVCNIAECERSMRHGTEEEYRSLVRSIIAEFGIGISTERWIMQVVDTCIDEKWSNEKGRRAQQDECRHWLKALKARLEEVTHDVFSSMSRQIGSAGGLVHFLKKLVGRSGKQEKRPTKPRIMFGRVASVMVNEIWELPAYDATVRALDNVYDAIGTDDEWSVACGRLNSALETLAQVLRRDYEGRDVPTDVLRRMRYAIVDSLWVKSTSHQKLIREAVVETCTEKNCEDEIAGLIREVDVKGQEVNRLIAAPFGVGSALDPEFDMPDWVRYPPRGVNVKRGRDDEEGEAGGNIAAAEDEEDLVNSAFREITSEGTSHVIYSAILRWISNHVSNVIRKLRGEVEVKKRPREDGPFDINGTGIDALGRNLAILRDWISMFNRRLVDEGVSPGVAHSLYSKVMTALLYKVREEVDLQVSIILRNEQVGQEIDENLLRDSILENMRMIEKVISRELKVTRPFAFVRREMVVSEE